MEYEKDPDDAPKEFFLRDVIEDAKKSKKTRVRQHFKISAKPMKKIKSIKCPKCPQWILPEELHQHYLKQHGNAVNLCSVCLSVFPNINTLAKHKSICFKKSRMKRTNWKDLPKWFDLSRAKENIFPCPVCAEEHHSTTELLEHMVAHDTATETFTCGPCTAVFFTMPDLKKHMFEHVVADQRKALKESQE